MAVASLVRSLVDLDHRLFLSINHGLHALDSEAVDGLLQFFNQAGTGWVAVPILGVLVAVSPAPRMARRAIEALGAFAVVATLLHVVKPWIARARPLARLADEFAAGHASLAFGESGRKNSLPSGHTATVFAMMTVLWAWAGRLPSRRRRVVSRALLLAGACLTGLARIYAGMHFPSDVLAGALAGVLSAILVLWLVGLVARSREARAPASAPAAGQDSTNP